MSVTGKPDTSYTSATTPEDAPRRGVVARALGSVKRHKRIVQIVVLVLIAGFLGSGVWRSGNELRGYSWHIQWGLLLAAFALFALQELSFALIWREILRRLGSSLAILPAERIYLGAEFVRYIPGNVWHVITRVLWAEQRGVPKPMGFASMVVELATKIASAALVFVVTLFFWRDATALTAHVDRTALVAAAAVGVPLLVVGLHPRLLSTALGKGMRLLKREAVAMPLSYPDVLIVTGMWAASWVVAGVGFYLLVLSVYSGPVPAAALALAIGIYAFGWDIGFLSFLTPSGLGVREIALAFLLTTSGLVPDAGLAIVVALLARLLTTASELTCIAGAYLASGRPGAFPEKEIPTS